MLLQILAEELDGALGFEVAVEGDLLVLGLKLKAVLLGEGALTVLGFELLPGGGALDLKEGLLFLAELLVFPGEGLAGAALLLKAEVLYLEVLLLLGASELLTETLYLGVTLTEGLGYLKTLLLLHSGKLLLELLYLEFLLGEGTAALGVSLGRTGGLLCRKGAADLLLAEVELGGELLVTDLIENGCILGVVNGDDAVTIGTCDTLHIIERNNNYRYVL